MYFYLLAIKYYYYYCYYYYNYYCYYYWLLLLFLFLLFLFLFFFFFFFFLLLLLLLLLLLFIVIISMRRDTYIQYQYDEFQFRRVHYITDKLSWELLLLWKITKGSIQHTGREIGLKSRTCTQPHNLAMLAGGSQLTNYSSSTISKMY